MLKITCDFGSDLPEEMMKRYRIDILPIPPAPAGDFQQSIEANYRKAFLKYTEQGFEVIHLALSASLSARFSCAQAAARDLGNIHVIDSQSLSIGTGQLALLAAELAGADYRPAEIVDAVEKLKNNLEIGFVIQQPQYLQKEVPWGKVAAFFSRKMNLKPLVSLRKGLLRLNKPLRGNMEQSILSFIRSQLEGRSNIQTDRVLVTYSQVPKAILDQVHALLLKLQPFEEILEAPAVSPLSRHCGPGCFGLSYLTNKETT